MTKFISTSIPVVVAIGGHDPSGGAGIQADIESIAAMGGHATTTVSCLTVQNTRGFQELHPVDPSLVRKQLAVIAEDFSFRAVKIGVLASRDIVNVVADFLQDRPEVPVVLDPVLFAGAGGLLSDGSVQETIRHRLFPLTYLITPNAAEARTLAGIEVDESAAFHLTDLGVKNVLITGGDEQGESVTNIWFTEEGEQDRWSWSRLSGQYHGTGCTLAAACATLVANQLPLKMALRLAQAYTYDAITEAHHLGRGQAIPRRIIPTVSDQ